ncbi:MAG: glycosyltransferase family 4 protein [Sedimenticola thiotaurini]|uniref:Glycosyltransferase family 4 protein n=1 Tax=Sedimenticola thiotaurini TaxID=1543721 RepID=A0A558DAU7_9GAMM|nr:MAG: glycosyltransferase family 4 protein [Sedimenticola thiotaurini]
MLMWFFLLAGLSSFVLTGFLRRYALKRNLLDVPNIRSSHQIPTPRGGGMAIVLVFLIGLAILAVIDVMPLTPLMALAGAGGWVALIGFIDDHHHIPAHWRLLAHFSGAVWVLIWIGGMPPFALFGQTLEMGWLGHGVTAVYLVWLLNLYNFMDGIDGIASIEALSVCLGGIVLYLLSPAADKEWVMPTLLLVSVAGFVFWNFPRARVFMGDAGSGFIGLVLGIFSIQAAWVDPLLFCSWVILLGIFVVDATLTLLRRIVRGECFFEAHRSHAYQYASRKYGSHVKVSLAVGLINLVWLLPVAIVVAQGWLDGLLGVVLAYSPLVWLAFHFNAGAREL